MTPDSTCHQRQLPDIAEDSVARNIFVRAYAEPRQQRRHRARQTLKEAKRRTRSTSQKKGFDGTFYVLDTETVAHRLTFGAFEEWRKRKLVSRGVFYRDSLPVEDPPGFERLRGICRALEVRLVSLETVYQQYIWPMRKRGGTLSCFNAPYDVSRLATTWHPATKTDRPGTRYCNGFSFQRSFRVLNEATDETEIASPIFARIKRDDRHHVRYDFKSGRILDLQTVVFALVDRNHSLTSACAAFGIPFENRPGAHSGLITGENVAGCLYDVAKTSELLWAVAREYEKHPIALPPHKAHSGAAIAKAYLDALGIQPRLAVQPYFSKNFLGYAAQAYFGGWVACYIAHTPIPCVYLDFTSMYPTVFSLLNLWFDQVVPDQLDVEEVPPEEIEALLSLIREDPDKLFDRALWPSLAFFAQVDPNGALLPTRAEVPTKYAKSLRNILLGPVESQTLLWYAGPDLAASAISGLSVPKVKRAWRLRPVGGQKTLRPVEFRGEVLVDPRVDDFFRVLIEQRKRITNNKIDDDLRKTGYKTIANSGAYGCLAETSPSDIDPDSEPVPRPVHVYGDREFATYVDRPEHPGRFCFFPTASLVTAGARLMLALAFFEIRRRGGEVAYCDTDGVMVAGAAEERIVPCLHGPHRTEDGQSGIRALSWDKIDEIRRRFDTLNPYGTGVGDLLKLEDENFNDDGSRSNLWFYGVSEKAYTLFTLDKNEPTIRKYSAHALGQYRSPIAGDRGHEWIKLAWQRKVRVAFGHDPQPFEWESYPAIAQLTLTTWSVMKAYAGNPNIRPFDFIVVATPTRSFKDYAIGFMVCCNDPRPSCFLFENPADWEAQDWRCLRCAKPIPSLRLRTYESVLRVTLDGFEVKRLCGDGTEPGPRTMRGLTMPRPVRVESVTKIGKEVIVDPTDTDEGLTAEMMSATSTVEYRDPEERTDRLRAAIKRAGVRPIARASRVNRGELQRILNHGSTPRDTTIEALEACFGNGKLPRPP